MDKMTIFKKDIFSVLNENTGELHKVPENYVVQIVSKEQKEIKRGIVNYNIRTNQCHWIACYHDSIESISKELSLINAGAILKLLPYMKFNENGVLIANKIPLQATEIEKILGKSKDATRKILKNLVELNVLNVEKVGRSNKYIISSEFHTKGTINKNLKFTKLYMKKLKEVSEGLKLNEIGLLYKILPYFHFEMFCLCENPNEQNQDKVIHMNRDTLAEKINHEASNVNKLINKLKKQGALITEQSRNKTHYTIHPDLMYRKSYDSKFYSTTVVRFKQFAK